MNNADSLPGETPAERRARIGHVPTDPTTWDPQDIDRVGLDVVFTYNPCGCRIVGNGTLPYPLSILFCAVHRSVE